MSERLSVGVLGASGFIGSRMVEWLFLNKKATVNPIVRSYSGMTRSARFDLENRFANATDQGELEKAFHGCDIVFHSVVGDRETILKSVECTYRAAANAGVRRLVYLSSAVVHGNDPEPGTNDESQLLTDQPFEYNISKVMAEQLFRELRSDRAVEVVILRPSIVFGPRSQWWSAQIALSLLSGNAYLIDSGRGICNTVYIDNLIHAMWLAATNAGAANEDFIITDGQRVTWYDLYSKIAEAIGVDITSIREVRSEDLPKPVVLSRKDRLLIKMKRNRLAYAIRELLPVRSRKAIRRCLRQISDHNPDEVEHDRDPDLPKIDQELVSLQSCSVVLPIEKARRILNYNPPISFAEGCQRTAEWLRFAMGIRNDA